MCLWVFMIFPAIFSGLHMSVEGSFFFFLVCSLFFVSCVGLRFSFFLTFTLHLAFRLSLEFELNGNKVVDLGRRRFALRRSEEV